MAERLDVREGAGWVNELNRDPRLRTPAGAGTQVIQKEQEKFMQQAWAQLGDLLQANQKIRQLQLAWMSTFVSYPQERPAAADRSAPDVHARRAAASARQPDDDREADRGQPSAARGGRSRRFARSRGRAARSCGRSCRPAHRDRSRCSRG